MNRLAWRTRDDSLEEERENKKSSLSSFCHKQIISGFDVLIKSREMHFSYDLDNQQNFTDTMRLFENNMINSVSWNAYIDKEKIRIYMSKYEFEKVYLAGVKHKADCLTTLNDYLLPMVESAKTIEAVDRIVWNDKLISGEFSTDNTNTLDRKAEKAEQTGKRNTSGILELTNLILSGGM